MRMGIVTGILVFSKIDPPLEGTRFLVVDPVTRDDLEQDSTKGHGRELIVADRLGAAVGQMIAFVEGREGCNPYFPRRVAVDAYASLIVETIDYRPPRKEKEVA